VIVLDTNILSEVLKPSPAGVLRWLAEQEPSGVFTTSVTAAEILHGVEVLPAGKRRTSLLSACEKILQEEFAGRILPFDEASSHLSKTRGRAPRYRTANFAIRRHDRGDYPVTTGGSGNPEHGRFRTLRLAADQSLGQVIQRATRSNARLPLAVSVLVAGGTLL